MLCEGLALQPPPRGCVLKRDWLWQERIAPEAAASARLCVETKLAPLQRGTLEAAASARLCVETSATLITG